MPFGGVATRGPALLLNGIWYGAEVARLKLVMGTATSLCARANAALRHKCRKARLWEGP